MEGDDTMVVEAIAVVGMKMNYMHCLAMKEHRKEEG